MRGSVAAGAGGDCAPAAPMGRFVGGPSTSPLGAQMRALLVLAAAVPTVLHAADAEVVSPQCDHPSRLESHQATGKPTDYILFRRGTATQTGITNLHQKHALTVNGYVAWKGLEGVSVPPLTSSQVAELRCDPHVELVVLQLGP